ncbi:hypothetical protein O0L34_g5335 [Tuta absoluta]|nr:hypothetical protein O0L34_g5335 [Tuta absoluta]
MIVLLLFLLIILPGNKLLSSENVLNNISTIGIPADCNLAPVKVQVDDCCQILPVFHESSYLECGFKSFHESDPSLKIPRNASDPNCAKYFCVLEKNSIAENGRIMYDHLADFLDEYDREHPDLSGTVNYAKLACTEEYLSFEEKNVCDAIAVIACLMATFFAECPGWDQSYDCKNLFNHLSQCNMLFMKKIMNEDKKKLKTASNMNLVNFSSIMWPTNDPMNPDSI